MVHLARCYILIGSICLLSGCESSEGGGFLSPRLATPSGASWPGQDAAAFDEMTLRTRCRPTLAAPDCRVMPVPPAAAPAPAGPAGGPTRLTPAGS